MSVSIRDVANNAGVSLATVSKVLNGKPATRIALATQVRVREAAKRLGYQPNRFAQGIATKQTNTLGLLISGLQNPFFLHILEEAELRLLDRGYQVVVDAAPSIDGTYVAHPKLRGWPVDGVLMWAGVRQSLFDVFGAQADGLPVVYLGYPRADDSSWVAFDLHAGGILAAQHLLSLGHTKIGFLHPWEIQQPNHFPVYKGFLDTCEAAGVAVQTIKSSRQEETQRAGLETGQQIASMAKTVRPTALMCHNDVLAIGAYHGLLRGGLKIPDDIALVGFDGIEEGQCLDKPLTTVQTPIDVFCESAVELLMNRLQPASELIAPQRIIPAKMLLGETT